MVIFCLTETSVLEVAAKGMNTETHILRIISSVIFSLCVMTPTVFAAQTPAIRTLQDHIQDESRYTVRSLALSIDVNSVRAVMREGQSMTIPLFDQEQVTLSRERINELGDGRLTWIGHSENARGLFAVRDGILVGTLRFSDGRVFDIRWHDEGRHVLREKDPNGPRQENDTLLPETYSEQENSGASDDDGFLDILIDQYQLLTSTTSTTTIDMFVVYTQAARQDAGSTSAMEAEIDLMIASFNDINTNSQVDVEGVLVGTDEVSYDEAANWDSALSESDNWIDMLNDLTGLSDGDIDDVHTSRDAVAADTVQLIVDESISGWQGGVAWVTSGESTAFAVIGNDNATAYDLFAHETGHLLGADHDTTAATGYGAYSYSLGHYVSSNFHTVMAYYSSCPGNCSLIDYWSNPNVSYNGTPTGTSTADNARTIENYAPTVAAFREPGCEPPSSGDWSITSDCDLSGTYTAPASITVSDGAVLNVDSSSQLNVDFANESLTIEDGSGVYIETGGKIY